MREQTPIQAFFNQANGTNTSWWSWLAVFWFAIMLWFYGQLIFGIPLAIVGMIVDPASLEAMMETQNGDASTQGGGYLLALGTIIAGSLAAFSTYLLRNKSSDGAGKRNIQIATVFGALSFAALVYFMKTGSSSDDAAMLNGWIAAVLVGFKPDWIGSFNDEEYIKGK